MVVFSSPVQARGIFIHQLHSEVSTRPVSLSVRRVNLLAEPKWQMSHVARENRVTNLLHHQSSSQFDIWDVEAFKFPRAEKAGKMMDRIRKKRNKMQILPHYYNTLFSSSIISEGIESALFQTKYQSVDSPRCNLILPIFFVSLEGLDSNLKKQSVCTSKVGRKFCLCPTSGTMFYLWAD